MAPQNNETPCHSRRSGSSKEAKNAPVSVNFVLTASENPDEHILLYHTPRTYDARLQERVGEDCVELRRIMSRLQALPTRPGIQAEMTARMQVIVEDLEAASQIMGPYFAVEGLIYAEVSPEMVNNVEGEMRCYRRQINRLHDLLVNRINNYVFPPSIIVRLQHLDLAGVPAQLARRHSFRQRTGRIVRRLIGRQASTPRLGGMNTKAAMGSPWDQVVEPPRRVRQIHHQPSVSDSDHLSHEDAIQRPTGH